METVVHLLSGIGDEQETALTIVENLVADDDAHDVVVVAQSRGIEAITTGGETARRVQALIDAGVTFKGCANALDAMGLDESDLVDGIEIVSVGALEVVELQQEGYAYLRP